MKKELTRQVLLFTILFTISSCNKQKEIGSVAPEVQKLVPVTFSVKDFNISIDEFSNTNTVARSVTANIPSDIKALVYWIYTDEPQPKFVRASMQINSFNYSAVMKKTSPITGVFTDSLEYGKKYNAYFAAVGEGLIDNFTYPPLNSLFNGNLIELGATSYPEIPLLIYRGTGNYIPVNCDAFFSDKINLDVNGASIDKSVALSRGVGKLVVKVNDANGLESSIQVKISKDAVGAPNKFDYKGLQNSSVMGSTASLNYSFSPIDNNNTGKYIFATDIPFDVIISATINGTAYTKTVQNVTCYRNKVTTLSGNLFDGGIGSTNKPNFSIDINNSWASDTTRVNF